VVKRPNLTSGDDCASSTVGWKSDGRLLVKPRSRPAFASWLLEAFTAYLSSEPQLKTDDDSDDDDDDAGTAWSQKPDAEAIELTDIRAACRATSCSSWPRERAGQGTYGSGVSAEAVGSSPNAEEDTDDDEAEVSWDWNGTRGPDSDATELDRDDASDEDCLVVVLCDS
jgi:hypothetical protein